MNKNDISVIIPVHSLENDIDKLMLKEAIQSVEKQMEQPEELIIIIPKSEIDNLKLDDTTLTIRIIVNTGETDFQSQLNFGVSKTTTEWFTFLEYDDEFSTDWIKNAKLYITKKADVGMFLPIIVDVNEEKQFIGFTNEITWANQFSNEMGILDLDVLKDYQNFNIDGMVLKKSTYESLGGLKSSIKLTFIYEFFLRIAYNGVRIMTIPKLGYKHVNRRVGSLSYNYKDITPEENRFWIDLASKEYYHKIDRKITYEKSEV